MPGVPETAWGVWGEPEPIKAWEPGAPKLHGDFGGSVQPGFSNTLKWFYNRATNPKDKKHCIRLLAQIDLKDKDPEKPTASSKCPTNTFKQATPKRPVSAQVATTKVNFQSDLSRPKTGIERPSKKEGYTKAPSQPTSTEQVTKAGNKFSTYQKQLQSVERLSRPKTAKRLTYGTHTSIDLLRPKSAMATIGRKRFDDPYLTTHEREFPGYTSGLYAEATRPMSSKGFTAPYKISDPIGKTTCENEFFWKESSKNEPIRSGTSSGNRRNNPHPHETFMVWKLPNKSAKGMITSTAPHLGYRELDDRMMDQILRDQIKSTYQCDYLGIPQGYQIKHAIDAPADWKVKIRKPLDTTVRRSYLSPQQHDELVGNTTRYGCNKKKGIAAHGAVPTVTSSHVKNQEVIKGKTTYETEFRDSLSQPDLTKLLNNQTNKRVIDSFLRYSHADAAKSKTLKSERRPESTSSQQGPTWVSKWQGPYHHEH